MKPPVGDPDLLLRAGQRCAALTLDLDRVRNALRRAVDATAGRWWGDAATAFATMSADQRDLVDGAAAVIERLGALTTTFAHELADAQVRVALLPEHAAAERRTLEEALVQSRTRFRHQLADIDCELTRLLLRRPVGPPRWTGPVLLPGERRNRCGPILAPRGTGPVRPPKSWTPPRGSIRLLPTPADQSAGAVSLPWTTPWQNGSVSGPPATRVQPIGAPV